MVLVGGRCVYEILPFLIQNQSLQQGTNFLLPDEFQISNSKIVLQSMLLLAMWDADFDRFQHLEPKSVTHQANDLSYGQSSKH